ncbi:Set1/Ash2 histone methyltransferase complex subunit ASH2 [Pichia californica]|uniref:Set1/Ash2 histone methyltransferase complex subunit ASH2 n=1 Tax=Pichia californica TaxID=460514 RepID=A0A9P6WL75_9ASCO|nr:Set1/Ash2 histone methyltransferase complex subunit ASH2 [[Candida] californica]
MRIPQFTTSHSLQNDKSNKSKQRFKIPFNFNHNKNLGKEKENSFDTSFTTTTTSSSLSSSPIHNHLYDSSPNTQLSSNSNITPRTVTILNNNNNTTLLNNLNLNDQLDYDYINNPLQNDSLDYIYNKNIILINNNKFIQSFTSLNSSLDTSSSPPISRSSSPLKFSILNQSYYNNQNLNSNSNLIDSLLLNHSEILPNFESIKKRKIENLNIDLNLSINSNTKFNLLFSYNDSTNLNHYELKFTSFNNDRLKLIQNLTLKEFIDNSQTNLILKLLKSNNLILKLKLFKSIFNFNINSIYLNDSNFFKNNFWSLKVLLNSNLNLNSDSNCYYSFYKSLMIDIINLLSILNSITTYILTNTNNNLSTEIDILSFYYNSFNLNDINDIKSNCNFQLFDHDLLDKFIYLLWKTEDSIICSQFRQLFN